MAAVAGRLETFERDIALATADLSPAVVARELARFAKEELARAIASGEASPTYDRYVNGQLGLPEDAVVPPGPIVYVFSHWPLAIRTALEELRKRVPIRSGRYANGFIVLANGIIARDYAQIGGSDEVVILNVRPYTRKMETGANKSGARHFENTRQVMNRRFRDAIVCDLRFLDVRSGLHPGVPWILKRSSGRRRSSAAGQPITYPALVLNMVR